MSGTSGARWARALAPVLLGLLALVSVGCASGRSSGAATEPASDGEPRVGGQRGAAPRGEGAARPTGADPLGPAETLAEGPGLSLVRWDLSWRGELFARLEQTSPELRAFRSAVRDRLLEVFPAAIFAAQAHAQDLSEAERANLDRARSGEGGRIRDLTRLEGYLLTRQLRRADMIARPTEFLAAVLRQGERLRVYSYTTDQAGVGGLSRVHEQLERDREAGWVLELCLHNHNFFFRPEDEAPLGAVAPSTADAWVFQTQEREFGLRAAAITNGFHTLEIPAAAFAGYAAEGPR